MIQTPPQLMPIQTEVLNKPCWFTRPPLYLRIERHLAITLSAVSFRDRYGRIKTCPPAYPTDGMSYPVVLSWFKDRFAWDTRRPATIHDFDYSMHDYLSDWPSTRPEADVGLLDGLRLDEPGWACVDYNCVRMFGQPIYNAPSDDPIMKEWIRMVIAGPDVLDAYIAGMRKQYGEEAVF